MAAGRRCCVRPASPTVVSVGVGVRRRARRSAWRPGSCGWAPRPRWRALSRERGQMCMGRVSWTKAADLLRPPPVPARGHPARGLVVHALHAELPRRRGPAGRTRPRRLVPNGPALGAEVRAGHSPAPPAGPREAHGALAPGRDSGAHTGKQMYLWPRPGLGNLPVTDDDDGLAFVRPGDGGAVTRRAATLRARAHRSSSGSRVASPAPRPRPPRPRRRSWVTVRTLLQQARRARPGCARV